jgi:hypothetical protein
MARLAMLRLRLHRRIACDGDSMSEYDRGGAYAPPTDDYETFDARDAEQDRRGWLFLAASAVVFVLFVAVVYNTFQLGVRERDSSPLIAADAEPYRVTPEDPGGYQAPDQDLSVTALREGGQGEAADTEAATPAPARAVSEEPSDPPARDMPALRIEQADADALDEPAESPAPAPAEAEASEPDAPPASDPPASDPVSEPAVQPAPTRADPPPQPAAEPAETSRSPAETLEASRSGDYVAQIAAYRSSGDAEAGWLNFVSRYPDLAIGRAPDIQRADLGERGVFHRLRIAGFGTREEAAAYCQTLQDRGQACLVARR